MKENRDNIYIYLWEEFNTVYIGRTVNPRGRHYQHKHRKAERTYQFSDEHGVKHPNMIIIESDLTIEEGLEREKYWIQYYKENNQYNVLNKSRGGQMGGKTASSILTDDERKERIKEYQKRYHEEHKEELNKKMREYYHKHKEFNRESDKKRSKEYYESHKEEIKKKYYENHEENKLKNRLAFKKYYYKHLDKTRKANR